MKMIEKEQEDKKSRALQTLTLLQSNLHQKAAEQEQRRNWMTIDVGHITGAAIQR